MKKLIENIAILQVRDFDDMIECAKHCAENGTLMTIEYKINGVPFMSPETMFRLCETGYTMVADVEYKLNYNGNSEALYYFIAVPGHNLKERWDDIRATKAIDDANKEREQKEQAEKALANKARK